MKTEEEIKEQLIRAKQKMDDAEKYLATLRDDGMATDSDHYRWHVSHSDKWYWIVKGLEWVLGIGQIRA